MVVSLCTVCKNRSAHYKATILKNIADHSDDPKVEFILLDYNSEDDLEEWVKTNLADHIQSGLLTYYKTNEPEYFHRSHSRNMVFRLAKGQVICNVDADNFTGPSFANFLRDCFLNDKNIFVCAGGKFDSIACSDIGGRIGITQEAFLNVSGYDEAMANYGFEDFDLIGRLEMSGTKKVLIKNNEFLEAIKHSEKNRLHEEFPYKNLKNIFLHYIDPTRSKILYVFRDDTFATGTLSSGVNKRADDQRSILEFSRNGIYVIEHKWALGKIIFHQTGKTVFLNEQSQPVYYSENLAEVDTLLLKDHSSELIFHALKDAPLIEMMLLFYSEIDNGAKMVANTTLKIIKPNNASIGKGVVYKNFDYRNPIILS